MLCCVGVASPDVLVLEGLELLLGAEFVVLDASSEESCSTYLEINLPCLPVRSDYVCNMQCEWFSGSEAADMILCLVNYRSEIYTH